MKIKPFIALILFGALLSVSLILPGYSGDNNLIEKLQLSPKQEIQLQIISEKQINNIVAILNSQQRVKLKEALSNSKSLRLALSSLNLSETQKTQIKILHTSFQNDTKKVLTLEQIEALKAFTHQSSNPIKGNSTKS